MRIVKRSLLLPLADNPFRESYGRSMIARAGFFIRQTQNLEKVRRFRKIAVSLSPWRKIMI